MLIGALSAAPGAFVAAGTAAAAARGATDLPGDPLRPASERRSDDAPPPLAEAGSTARGELRHQPPGHSDGSAEAGTAPEERSGSVEAREEEAEARIVADLEARDREVRAHEQAHLAAAGALARGGPTYETVRGPDGKLYATGGEVDIDTGEVSGDPQATIAKARRIRAAALAPADPSSQDRRVAAEASAMEREARAELAEEKTDAASESEAAAAAETRAESARCPQCGGSHGGAEHAEMNQRTLAQALSQSAPPDPAPHQLDVTA